MASTSDGFGGWARKGNLIKARLFLGSACPTEYETKDERKRTFHVQDLSLEKIDGESRWGIKNPQNFFLSLVVMENLID
jgi:hypothetical protein